MEKCHIDLFYPELDMVPVFIYTRSYCAYMCYRILLGCHLNTYFSFTIGASVFSACSADFVLKGEK